jgi:hypothetical protein
MECLMAEAAAATAAAAPRISAAEAAVAATAAARSLCNCCSTASGESLPGDGDPATMPKDWSAPLMFEPLRLGLRPTPPPLAAELRSTCPPPPQKTIAGAYRGLYVPYA